MKAVIRGDFHASMRDARALFDRDCDGVDVLYIEGRGDSIDIANRGASFYLFLMGFFSLKLLYSFVSWFYQYLSGNIDIKERAESNGWRVQSNIDAEIHEIFDETADSIARWLFVLAVILVGFAFVWGAIDQSTFGIPSGVLSTLLVLILPVGYFGFLLLSGFDTPNYRDKAMVESVVSDATLSDADFVILFVGDRHVPVVADLLEQEGWDVSQERSTHIVSRLSRFAWRISVLPISWVGDQIRYVGRPGSE